MHTAPRKQPSACCQQQQQEGCHPRNYLTKGGVRAVEHQLDAMNRAVLQVWGLGEQGSTAGAGRMHAFPHACRTCAPPTRPSPMSSSGSAPPGKRCGAQSVAAGWGGSLCLVEMWSCNHYLGMTGDRARHIGTILHRFWIPIGVLMPLTLMPLTLMKHCVVYLHYCHRRVAPVCVTVRAGPGLSEGGGGPAGD